MEPKTELGIPMLEKNNMESDEASTRDKREVFVVPKESNLQTIPAQAERCTKPPSYEEMQGFFPPELEKVVQKGRYIRCTEIDADSEPQNIPVQTLGQRYIPTKTQDPDEIDDDWQRSIDIILCCILISGAAVFVAIIISNLGSI